MSDTIILSVAAQEAADGVSEPEFMRLLGVPPGREMADELRERAVRARQWYASHGSPFVAARRLGLRSIGPDSVTLDTGAVLAGAALAERLREGEAHALVVAAVSAGREPADEAVRLWTSGCPDESWFLDRFAAVVAEHLVRLVSAAMCARGLPADEGMLPHLSPGCGRWDIAAQHALMALLASAEPAGAGATAIGTVSLLPSGALSPQHSLLAAFGVTRRAIVATPESACRACDMSHCRYRRAAYARGGTTQGTTR